jgi:hypothetical protein
MDRYPFVMANLARVRVEWSGSGVVGPGLSTFYFAEEGSGWTAALGTFFETIKPQFHTTVSWRIPGSGDLIDVASGELSGTWTDGAEILKNGSSVLQYAAGCGLSVKWLTSGIRNGRRVTGRTFLCPITAGAYGTNGEVLPAVAASIQSAAHLLTLAGGLDMHVYSRPLPSGPGFSSPVLDAATSTKVSWLRSRRI